MRAYLGIETKSCCLLPQKEKDGPTFFFAEDSVREHLLPDSTPQEEDWTLNKLIVLSKKRSILGENIAWHLKPF